MKRIAYFTLTMITLLALACGGGETKVQPTEKDGIKEVTEKVVEGKIKHEKIVPKEKTTEEKIQDIRTMYSEIEGSLSSLNVQKVHYANPAPEMYYDHSDYEAFYKADELVKLVESGGEEMYLFKTSYYFNKGELFFIYNEGEHDGIQYVQNRYYITGKQIIKALTKEKGENDEHPPLSKMKNTPNPNFVKDAHQITKNQFKAYEEALERYAASK